MKFYASIIRVIKINCNIIFYRNSDKRSVPGIDCFINGVPKTPSKIVKVFEISETVWPSQSPNTPQESEAFVRFMVHISRWKRRNNFDNTTGKINNAILVSRNILLIIP